VLAPFSPTRRGALRSTNPRMIELFDDFRDILVELHRAGARFVVLGGHAVAFHGHPRYQGSRHPAVCSMRPLLNGDTLCGPTRFGPPSKTHD